MKKIIFNSLPAVKNVKNIKYVHCDSDYTVGSVKGCVKGTYDVLDHCDVVSTSHWPVSNTGKDFGVEIEHNGLWVIPPNFKLVLTKRLWPDDLANPTVDPMLAFPSYASSGAPIDALAQPLILWDGLYWTNVLNVNPSHNKLLESCLANMRFNEYEMIDNALDYGVDIIYRIDLSNPHDLEISV